MKKCCGNNIGIDYINKQNRALKHNKDTHDLALITYEPQENFSSTKLENNILGFIIIQKGECSKFNDTYCINLICSPSLDERSKGIGSILIALYIYCIMNNDDIIEKRGLLELANSYVNMGGLCLYSKYGFVYDPLLYGADCFNDYNNLPMIVEIDTKYGNSNEIIKDILLGKNKGFQKPPICSIRENDKQLLIGILMNLDKFLKLNNLEYITSYIMSNNTSIEYELLYNLLGNSPEMVEIKINELMTGELSDEDRELLSKIYVEPNIQILLNDNKQKKPQFNMKTRNKRQTNVGGSKKFKRKNKSK